MAEMKGHDQVERYLSHRLDQQPGREPIALVKRENRIDEGRAGGRETRVGENLFGAVNGAGDGFGDHGYPGLEVSFAASLPFQLPSTQIVSSGTWQQVCQTSWNWLPAVSMWR